jgi:hypothetical protein
METEGMIQIHDSVGSNVQDDANWQGEMDDVKPEEEEDVFGEKDKPRKQRGTKVNYTHVKSFVNKVAALAFLDPGFMSTATGR